MRGVVFACALAAAGPAAAKTCVVDGKAVEPFTVSVAPKGGLTLSVKVRGVEASAKIGETPGPSAIEVRGAFAFTGVVATESLPLKWKKTVDSANGMVRIPAGATVSLDAHAKGRWLEGDLMDEGVRFRGVTFPCDGLTLDAVAPASLTPEPDEEWHAKAKSLTLRFEATSGPTMEIVMPDEASITWHRLSTASGMVRLATKLRDGTYVTGWVKSADVTRPKGTASAGELQDLPIPAAQPRCGAPPEVKPGTRIVDAAVDAGTAVLYDRLFPWATVKTATTYKVRIADAGQFAELVGVPGVATATDCDADTTLEEAWVPRAAVHLAAPPPDGGPKK
jgi:hypothetical protein